VKRVLVTGMAGTGKSSLLQELAARGYRTVDTDYGDYFETVDGERLWREDGIRALLSSAPDELPGVLFVQGTTRNQGLFYTRFHHIVLLSAPADVCPVESVANLYKDQVVVGSDVCDTPSKSDDWDVPKLSSAAMIHRFVRSS